MSLRWAVLSIGLEITMPRADLMEELLLRRRVTIISTVAHTVVIGDGGMQMIGKGLLIREPVYQFPPRMAGLAVEPEVAGTALQFAEEFRDKWRRGQFVLPRTCEHFPGLTPSRQYPPDSGKQT